MASSETASGLPGSGAAGGEGDSLDAGAGMARITMISSRSTVTCGAVAVHSLGSRSPNQAAMAAPAPSAAGALSVLESALLSLVM